jgi:hypothetical protein
LRDWLLALKPAQIWSILVALALLVGGSFSLGASVGAKVLGGERPSPSRSTTAPAIVEIASWNVGDGSE